jgi:D-glycero-D-manno-heptose 1,7-bisphosphate phosphatase
MGKRALGSRSPSNSPAKRQEDRAPIPPGRAGQKSGRAVFLDRDGVINQPKVIGGKPYPPASIEEFVLLPGVKEACRRLKAAGFLLVVATNQPDVGRGTLPQSAVEAMHDHLARLLPIDRVEVSYESGRESPPSEFRKPRPGMLRRAARELGIDLARSYMVGDRWRDIDCGHAAGCTTILIDYGYAEELRRRPHHRVQDLQGAVDIILDLEHKTAL